MKTVIHNTPILLLLFLFAALSYESAQAQSTIHPGIRAGVYSDAGDVFVGGELLAPLGNSWNLNPNIEYIFAENMTYATFNIDFAYNIPSSVRFIKFWAGAGPAFVYTNVNGPSEGNTDLGLNLFGGIGFRTGRVTPYIQPKVIIKDNTEFALGFGIRF